MSAPSLHDIRAARTRLGTRVVTTPVRELVDDAVAARLAPHTRVWLKEELFQRTGSFKPRGALTVMLDLTAHELARGVTGVSAGNHAISLGYCARELGTTATVVMPRTALGTATVGLEFLEQVQHEGAQLDAVIVAAGGGGLTGGIACAVKQLSPHTAVYVVEPEGADTMHRSFAAGSPQSIDKVRTIADSLGAPRCEPYSYALNRQFVDDVVLVTDDQIRDAMRLTFRAAKLVTEPAGSAALAALLYPLRDQLAGRTVGLVVCGGNIDTTSFCAQIAL